MKRYCEISVGTFDKDRATKLAQRIHCTPRMAQLLINRGIDNPARYMSWSLTSPHSLHDPATLPDIDKAVLLLHQALEEQQLVYICGDYDADGICATTILMRGLSALNMQVDYQLPLRQDGYGFNRKEVDRALELGASLIVTVDCGSSNADTVNYAQANGLKVIVTDHHQVGHSWPSAEAFINPQRPDSLYPEPQLCGAAVAWKVLTAFYRHLGRPDPLDLLEFVAFATITDIMPLTGENRLLARLGLARIEQWHRPCLRALGDIAGVRNRPLNAKSISFFMGPRLNSLGRMHDANLGAAFMLCDDFNECQARALAIEQCNEERREHQDSMVESVKASLDLPEANRRGFIFESGPWRPGIVGIAAGHLMNSYQLTCLMAHEEGELLVGSGRAPDGTNLYAILHDCQEVLAKFGGHEAAAGFSLPKANLPRFLELLEKAVARHRRPAPPLFVDFEMKIDEVTVDFIHELKGLEPTGANAPAPCFLFKQVRLTDLRPIKDGQFIGCRLKQQGVRQFGKAVAFSTASELKHYQLLDKVCDVVCSLSIDTFDGQVQPSFTIDSIIAADEAQLRLLDQEEGLRPARAYSAHDFTPVPPDPLCPAAISLASNKRQAMIERMQQLGGIGMSIPTLPKTTGNASASSAEASQGKPSHVLHDQRGCQANAYISSLMSQGASRADGIAVVSAHKPADLPALKKSHAVSLTWRDWVNSPLPFREIIWLDPPLDLQQAREALKKTAVLHLAYAEERWQEIEEYLNSWQLSLPQIERAWERLRLLFSQNPIVNRRELTALELPPRQLEVALRVWSESQLITITERAGQRLLQRGPGQNWEVSPTWQRQNSWQERLSEARQLLSAPLSPAVFWPNEQL